MKLYELSVEMQKVMDAMEQWAIEHDGDVSDFPMLDNLATLDEDFKQKVLSVAAYIKGLEAEVNAFKAEEERLERRRETTKRKVEFLKGYITSQVQSPADFHVSDARAKVSFRPSKVVDIIEENRIPVAYMRIPVAVPAPDKKLIKEALERGTAVDGAVLVKRLNLSIQ
jgi:hypothetical protein